MKDSGKKHHKTMPTIENGMTAFRASIVDSSDDAIIGKTLEGLITSWNRAAESMYGYAADEIIAKPISILLPSDRPKEMEDPRKIRAGERIDHYETVRRHKTARPFRCLTVADP
jgi:PAS domain S-box-containing protein